MVITEIDICLTEVFYKGLLSPYMLPCLIFASRKEILTYIYTNLGSAQGSGIDFDACRRLRVPGSRLAKDNDT